MRHHALRFVRPVLFVLTTALILGFACSDKSTGPHEVFAPQIASIAPERGQVGTLVAIKGSHFGSEIGSILFADRAPYVALWSDTLIQADAPAQIKEPCYIRIGTGEDKADSIWFVVEYLLIESISPDHGLPGYEVTITGQNFGSATGAVLFDSLNAEIVSWSSNQITVIVPENATSCNVEVHYGSMVSNQRGFAIDGMTITQIIPNRAIPNTEIEIHGYMFGDQPGTVQFQDALAEVISWSDTLIITKAPIGASSGNVTVEFGGAISNAISFNVEVLSISRIEPDTGLYDSQVEIHGRFYNVDEAHVFLGEVELQIISISDTVIVIEIPFGANSGEISIQAYGQTSNQLSLEVVAMLITSISPTEGIPGTQVTIDGLSFGDQQGTVTIDGLEAEISYWSNTRIRCLVPPEANSGDLIIHVGDEESNAIHFEVHHMTITSVEPDSGIAGQKIAIHGEYFGPKKGSVYIGEVEAPVESWSDTLIEIRVPDGAISGQTYVSGAELSNAVSFYIIENPNLLDLLRTANAVDFVLSGYHRFEENGDTIWKFAYMQSECYPGVEFKWNGSTFSIVDTLTDVPMQWYSTFYYDIQGQLSANGDSLISINYHSKRHMYWEFMSEWIRIVDADCVMLPLTQLNLQTGIVFSLSGPAVQNHFSNAYLYSFSHDLSIMDPQPASKSLYLETDWDNEEYPPVVQIIFRQK